MQLVRQAVGIVSGLDDEAVTSLAFLGGSSCAIFSLNFPQCNLGVADLDSEESWHSLLSRCGVTDSCADALRDLGFHSAALYGYAVTALEDLDPLLRKILQAKSLQWLPWHHRVSEERET